MRRPDRTLATADHNVPTDGTPAARADRGRALPRAGRDARAQLRGVRHPVYSLGSDRQGIVHVIGPELGVTQPGMTIVCGDSHTSTHGAFGALAFGIGTSEVEHVLATQCLVQQRPKTMRITYTGELGRGVTAKDLILATIGRLGAGGMVGYVVEYAGAAIEALSMEGRMTICNMTIEGGGRAGMIAPDETTFEYVRGPPAAPRRTSTPRSPRWRELPTDDGARVRRRGRGRRVGALADGHLGHQPRAWSSQVTGAVPEPASWTGRPTATPRSARSTYMALEPGTPMTRHRARPRVHRLLHQLAHRGPARGRRGGRGPEVAATRPRDGRPGLAAGEGPGRGRGPRPGLPRRPASSGATPAARCAWA